MTFLHRGMNVCSICEASLATICSDFNNRVYMYYVFNWLAKKKDYQKKSSEFEANLWPETGHFFCLALKKRYNICNNLIAKLRYYYSKANLMWNLKINMYQSSSKTIVWKRIFQENYAHNFCISDEIFGCTFLKTQVQAKIRIKIVDITVIMLYVCSFVLT